MRHHSNVEWARRATQKEIEAHKWFIQEQRAKAGKSIEYCCQHYEMIIRKHEEFKEHVLQEKYAQFRETALYNLEDLETKYNIVQRFKKGEISVACDCGGKWKLISFDGRQFIGCTDYKKTDEYGTHNGIKHSFLLDFEISQRKKEVLRSFNYTEFCNKYNFTQHYIADFRRFAKLPEFVKSQSIYEVLTMHGVPLLNPNIDDSNFNTAPMYAQNAKRQEALIMGTLERIFNGNVEYQFYIKYKYKGSKKESIAIPDYVCYNKDTKTVYVFDAKKNIHSANDKLYRDRELIKVMLSDKPEWKVVAKFIFWDAVNYSEGDIRKSDGLTIEMLNNGEF